MSPRSPVPGAGRGRTFYVGDEVWAELDRTYSRYRAETQDNPKLGKHEFVEDALRRGLAALGREVQRAAEAGEPTRRPRRRGATSRRAAGPTTHPAPEPQHAAAEPDQPVEQPAARPAQPARDAGRAPQPRRRAAALLDASDPGGPALTAEGGTAT